MLQALVAAGFVGIEQGDGGVIYARPAPHLPEFSLTPDGDGWCFCLQWPLRATAVQCDAWTAQHPDAPMDVHLGETRIEMRAGPEALARWRELAAQMVAQCTTWRRATRQMDEGM